MNENDLPEDLARPERGPSVLRDPMFWVATVLLLCAVGVVAVGVSSGAMQ